MLYLVIPQRERGLLMRISDTKHTHRHIHIQVDFFKAVLSETRKSSDTGMLL